MKHFKVQSLWETSEGIFTAGVPEYLIEEAIKEKVNLRLTLTDGKYMSIPFKKLDPPYSVSKPVVNRNFPRVGKEEYTYWNYVFKEDLYSIIENETVETEEVLKEGNYDSFEDLKKAKKKEEPKENNPDIYMITQIVQIPTPVTLSGYMGHVFTKKREELGLTDREVVARILENQVNKTFTINTYRRIERGEDTNSKLNTYGAIARALGLHISKMLPPE